MVASMGGACQICGYSRCNDALEFHHLDPTSKEFSFGELRSNPRRIGELLRELKKCILLCSICHKEVHAGLAEVPKTYAKINPNIFGWYETENGFERLINDKIKVVNVNKLKFEISPEELVQLMKTNSLVAIGKMFGVSDNAIRKRAKKFDIL